MLVVALPFRELLGQFDTRSTLGFLVCAGTFFTIVYLITIAYAQFYSQWAKGNNIIEATSSDHFKLLEKMAGATVSKDVLVNLMRRIRPDIINACAHSWRSYIYRRKLDLAPVRVNDVKAHYSREAIQHIHNSRKNRNILTICQLQTQGQDLNEEYTPKKDNPWLLRMYKSYTSFWYNFIVYLVIVVHIACAFAEPNTFSDMRQLGANLIVIWIEGSCLLIELVDFTIRLTLKYRWTRRNFLDTEHSLGVDMAYFFIYFLILVDWFLIVIAK